MRHVHLPATKIEPPLAEIDDSDFCAGELHKFQRRQANRTRANNDHAVSRFWVGLVQAMQNAG